MQSVRVWDLPTRFGHWLLALLVIVAIVTSEEKGLLHTIHIVCGIGAGVIVLFRLVWGVIGNERARFADFVYGWARVRAYALDLLRLKPPRHIGHNPLGGWMVVALLAVVLFATATGLVVQGLLGPGAGKAAEEVHEAIGSLIQIMIVVHVAGVLIDWLLTGDNLIAAMIGGRKHVVPVRVDESAATDTPRDARGGNVWLALAIALPLALGGVWLFGQVDPAARPGDRESGSHD